VPELTPPEKKYPAWLEKIFYTHIIAAFMSACRAVAVKVGTPEKIYHFVDGSPLIVAFVAFLTRRRVMLHIWGFPPQLAPIPAEASLLKRLWLRFKHRINSIALRNKRLTLIMDSPIIAKEVRAAGIPAHVIDYAIPEEGELPTLEMARTRLNIGGGALICLLFGTHRSDKDYETVFKALAGSTFKTQLLIVGSTISGTKPEVQAQRYPGVHAVIRNTFVTEEEAALWFAACDVVILPYRQGRVLGSGVVYESLRHERPVIATAGGFLGEFVSTHKTGITYRDDDDGDLQRALASFCSMSPQERQDLATHLRVVKNQHGWASRIGEYTALYDQDQS
jgi:glycosyltransferase involved in cell wall biosynthesis